MCIAFGSVLSHLEVLQERLYLVHGNLRVPCFHTSLHKFHSGTIATQMPALPLVQGVQRHNVGPQTRIREAGKRLEDMLEGGFKVERFRRKGAKRKHVFRLLKTVERQHVHFTRRGAHQTVCLVEGVRWGEG